MRLTLVAHAAALSLSVLALLASCGDDSTTSPLADASAPLGDAPTQTDAGADAPPRAAGTWSARASMPAPQQEVAVVALGGKIYVIGGFAAEQATTAVVSVFDPAVGAWSTAAPLPEALHHVNAATADGKIWVVGALRGAAFGAVGTTLAYDPTTNAWTPRAAMPAGSERGASMVAAIGKIIYVAGGFRGGSVADFSSFDTASGAWTTRPPIAAARDHGVGLAIGDRFYAIGGRDLAGHTSRVEAFDPITSAWTPRASMPTSRAGSAAAVMKGLAIVAGGEGSSASPIGMFAEVEAYDPVRDAWSALPAMTTPRHGTGAATIDDVMYVPGGGIVAGHGATAVVEALTLP